MLPSSGYFRDLVCPYLKLGFCERTHCHYKHDVKPSSAHRLKARTAVSSTSAPAYVPTPVSKLKCGYHRSDTKSGDDSPRAKHSSKSVDVPVYKPTPISELKKKQIGSYGQTSTNDIKPTLAVDDDNSGKIAKKEKKTAAVSVSDVIKDSAVPLGRRESKECDKISLKSKKIKTDISVDKSSGNNNKNIKCAADDQKSTLKAKQKLEKSYSKTKSSDNVLIDLTDDSDEHFYETSTKKIRIAHNPLSAVAIAKEKKEKRLNPTQVMRQRFTATQTDDKSNGNLHAKVYGKTSEQKISSNSDSADEIVGNSVVGKKRIAHKPAVSNAKRPTMPIHFGNKIPMKTRQLFLNKFIDEFLTFCAEEDAYKRQEVMQCEAVMNTFSVTMKNICNSL